MGLLYAWPFSTCLLGVKKMNKLLSGGRVLDTAINLDDLQDILIEEGKISSIGPPGSFDDKLGSPGKIIDSAKTSWKSGSVDKSICSVCRASSSAWARAVRDSAASRAPARDVLPW